MEGYFQTWHWMVRLRRVRLAWLIPVCQYLCGVLIGHEMSKTEWGYSGGQLYDRWCRWCNKRFQVPAAEEPAKNFLMEMFHECGGYAEVEE